MTGAPPERNIKLTVEYDGTAYAGWQFQVGLPTVQQRLMEAIERMAGHVPLLAVAGRTDAGVHAEGQVTNFRTTCGIEARRFVPGLNSLLPRDISVHSAEEVPVSFDARHHSVSKIYRYRVYVGWGRAALEEHRAWHIRHAFDLPAMRAAAALLVGDHDFNAFRSTACDAPHARRNMFSIDVDQRPRAPSGEVVEITFHANAYCRHMCRILSGTLVEVAVGKRDVQSVAHALAKGDRTLAGMTAPPCGLTLLTVFYS